MPIALSRAIDQWIAAQPKPKPSRPEAIRRLVEMALSAQLRAEASAVESSKWKYGGGEAEEDK